MRMSDSMDKREFDGGNPQQDAPRRVQKKRIWTRRRLLRLGIVAAVLLAVVAVSLLWQRGTFDGLRRSVIYARAEKDENGCAQLYQYAADREYRFVSLSGSLAAASNSRILLMGEDGQVRYSESILFTNCTVTGNGKWAAVYDVGGKEIYVLDTQGEVYRLTLDGDILAAALNPGGYLAVTVNTSGYKASVEVYDPKGEKVFAFHSGDQFLMTAAVSADSRQMAAVTMGQEDGSFVSSLALYRLGREERYAECLLPENALVYDLGAVGGSYCAVTETGLRFVTTGGKLAGSYSYDGGYLHRCSLGGDGYAALLLGRYKSGSQGRLVTVDSQGRELASLDIDEEVMSLSAAGKYVAVLYQDHLTIYDKDLQEYAVLKDVSAAGTVLMRSDGSAVLTGASAASLYLP